MADLSALSGAKRKLDFVAVRSAFDLLRQRFDLPQDRGFGNGVNFFPTKVRGLRP